MNVDKERRSDSAKRKRVYKQSTCTFSNLFEERRDLDIQYLRQATEADHSAVEASVPLMHRGLVLAEYVRCLQQIYRVVTPWEERAAEVEPVGTHSSAKEGSPRT